MCLRSAPSVLPSEPPAPAPKRRKLEAVTSSASLVPSETPVGEHRITRERNLSPESRLSTVPQVITAGSKRYAPLPPECRKSQPNHKAARNVWAKKEQAALKRLGLRVVRTFIREEGMVIDWETCDSEPVYAATVIERSLLLNYAGTQSSKRTTPFLARISPDPDQNRTPSVVEVSSHALEDHHGCEYIGVAQICKPCQEGGSSQQGHPVPTSTPWQTTIKVDTPAPVTRLGISPGKFVHDLASDHTRHHQTADNTPSTATPQRSSSLQVPHQPSQHHSISPQLPQSLPSPSQRSIDTLQRILHMKRQLVRQSPDLLKPPVVSSLPSPSLQKPYPVPMTPQYESSSRQSPKSSADAVAAAINKGALLDRQRSTTTPSLSTPLRVYKRRPTSSVHPMWRNDGSGGLQDHQMRRSVL